VVYATLVVVKEKPRRAARLGFLLSGGLCAGSNEADVVLVESRPPGSNRMVRRLVFSRRQFDTSSFVRRVNLEPVANIGADAGVEASAYAGQFVGAGRWRRTLRHGFAA
jgi:hypothetical protein